MGKPSRDKGKAGELEVCHIWHAHGFEAWRTPNSGGLSHSKGDVHGVPGLHQEVKRQEKMSMLAWLHQAEADCNPLDVPVVIWRPSHEPWRVTLPFEDFAPMWKLRVS